MKALFDDKEAEHRYALYKSKDPFPEIQPALLNSADIHDYVAATGMIAPYYSGNRKSASYEVPLEGKIFYWDGDNKDCSQLIDKDDKFVLRKNSIAFVSLKTKFRIPDYIALRFNLRIINVHRGLLLGTGPLVDPGFEGNLLIPLHNLTSNDFELTGGEGFIWVEFTKLSTHPRWENSFTGKIPKNGEYKPFPEDGKNKSPEYYLSKASPFNTIRSSIPEAIHDAQLKAEEAQQSANQAKDSAENAEKKVKNITKYGSIGIVVGTIIALGAAIWPVVSLVQDSMNYVKATKKENEATIKDLEQKIKSLADEISKIQKESAENQEKSQLKKNTGPQKDARTQK